MLIVFSEELHFFELCTCVIPSGQIHISLEEGPCVYNELYAFFLPGPLLD